MSACGFCGHTPACGFAEIDGTRYCHGDCPHEDDGLLSCYEQAGLAQMQSRTLIAMLDDPKETP